MGNGGCLICVGSCSSGTGSTINVVSESNMEEVGSDALRVLGIMYLVFSSKYRVHPGWKEADPNPLMEVVETVKCCCLSVSHLALIVTGFFKLKTAMLL